MPYDLNVALLKTIMNSVPARDKKTKHRLPVPLRQPQQLALTDVVDPYNIGVHRYNPRAFMPGGGNMCHPDLDGRTGSGGLVQLGSGEFVWVSSDALLRMRSGMLGAGAMGSGALGSSPGGKTEVPPVERKVAPPTEEKDVGKDAGTSKVAGVAAKPTTPTKAMKPTTTSPDSAKEGTPVKTKKGCPSFTPAKVIKKPAVVKKPAAATAAGKKAGGKDPLPKFPGLRKDSYPLRYMRSTVYLQSSPKIAFRIKPCSGEMGRVDCKVYVQGKDTAAAWVKVCEKLSEYNK